MNRGSGPGPGDGGNTSREIFWNQSSFAGRLSWVLIDMYMRIQPFESEVWEFLEGDAWLDDCMPSTLDDINLTNPKIYVRGRCMDRVPSMLDLRWGHGHPFFSTLKGRD